MNEDLIQDVLRFVTRQTVDKIPKRTKNTMQISDPITDSKIQKLTKMI